MMIKAVFFDIDDTLLDFKRSADNAMERAYHSLGETMPAELSPTYHRINAELWRRIEEGTLSRAEHKRIRFKLIFDELGIKHDPRVFEEMFLKEMFSSAIEVKNADLILSRLRGRCPLYAASNAPVAAQQINRLKLAGMLEKLDGVFVSGDIGAVKPAKEFFVAVMERAKQQKAEECLFVGDSYEADIVGAKNAGMQTCLFDPKEKYLITPMADHVIRDLALVESILK